MHHMPPSKWKTLWSRLWPTANSSQYDLAINAYIAARTAWLDWIEIQGVSSFSSKDPDNSEDEDLSDGEIERRKSEQGHSSAGDNFHFVWYRQCARKCRQRRNGSDLLS